MDKVWVLLSQHEGSRENYHATFADRYLAQQNAQWLVDTWSNAKNIKTQVLDWKLTDIDMWTASDKTDRKHEVTWVVMQEEVRTSSRTDRSLSILWEGSKL